MKIKKKTILKLKEHVAVYDIEVANTENFKLANASFVHNSKDIADALGQVVYNCHKNSEYADEALLPRTAINDNVVPEENLEEYLKEFDAWARK